jgi:glycosyltransferase involved in cell wall biosynthesis
LATVSEATMSAWAASGVRIGRLLRNGVPDLAVERGSIEPVALIAGRLSPEKGVEQGVAAALLAGLRPLVVGAAYDRDYQPNLSGAEVLAPLPRGELRRLMARCAVTLAPLRWEEPFGLVYAEAQLAGCPVAGFRRGALPEVVPEGVGGHLVPADDVPALARAARSALNLDRDRVWESALGRFGMEPVLDAYERALRAVAR